MNESDLGLVIDEIRRNRNMTISALCEGIISPSTYSRFVSGKTMIAADSFMKLVFRLHMTFAMFLQDYQDFFRIKHHYAMLNHAKGYHDLALVQQLVADYQARYMDFQASPHKTKDWGIHDERFLMVSTALASQLSEDPHRQQQLEVVQDHIKQYKALSDNDFFALKLLLPYMTLADAEAVVKKTLKQLTDLKETALEENLFYVCGIMYIKNLAAGQRKKAAHYYKMLEEIYLDPLDLGWKLSQQFYQNIHLYFTADAEKAVDQINKLSAFYSDLNLAHQSQFIAKTCRELNIPHQEMELIK